MRKSRFTEEQIIAVLQEAEAVAVVRDLCRRHGITETTFYRWRTKYGGMQVSEARRLKQLEAENARLKRLVADQALNLQVLKESWETDRDGPGAAPGRQAGASCRSGV